MKNIGEVIEQKLVESGRTRADLARYLRVSKATISYWVSGRSRPAHDRLREIANFLGCGAGELLGERSQGLEEVKNERLRSVVANLIATHQRVLKRGANQSSLLTSIEGILKGFQEVEGNSPAESKPKPR